MADTKPKVEKEDHDEDKSEVLGNLVKVVVLIWSASLLTFCLLYTSPSPRDVEESRMPSSA